MKLLTFVVSYIIVKVVSYKGGMTVANKSRAEYFRERRKTMKQFNVMLKKEKIEALEEKIKSQGKTKVEWFEEIVDKELGETK